MKRRSRRYIVTLVAAAMLAAPAAPAFAQHGKPWFCAAVDAVDQGVCVYDPIPPPPRELVPEGL